MGPTHHADIVAVQEYLGQFVLSASVITTIGQFASKARLLAY